MAVPGLSIRELADKQVLVLAIEGEVPPDARSAALETALGAVRRCTKYIVADFSRAECVSSTVPGLLAYYSKGFPIQGIRLLAVKGPERVMALMAATGADRMVPFFNTLDDALEEVRLAEPSGTPQAT